MRETLCSADIFKKHDALSAFVHEDTTTKTESVHARTERGIIAHTRGDNFFSLHCTVALLLIAHSASLGERYKETGNCTADAATPF